MSSVTDSDAGACGLADLRAEFPRFRIWQETVGDRVRYVARRLHPGAHRERIRKLGRRAELRRHAPAGGTRHTPDRGHIR
jgi:hypothetical protein